MSQSAAVRWSGRGSVPRFLFLALAIAATSSRASAEETAAGETRASVLPPVAPHVFDGDVRDLPKVVAPGRSQAWEHEEPPLHLPHPPMGTGAQPGAVPMPNVTFAPMPSTLQSFDGLSRTTSVTSTAQLLPIL